MAETYRIGIAEIAEAETYVSTKVAGLPSTKAALEKAKADNLKIVYPKSNELQIDIDRPEDYAVWQAHRGVLDEYFRIVKVVETPSNEKGHLHITVTIDGVLNPFERIAFQAVLGSDRKRELLGLIMNKLGHESRPTLFLEKKDATS